MSIEQQTPFQLHRLATVMEPDPEDPAEAWGVLNPASARDRDGQLYLFPRLVAEGNYSRIGIARVHFKDGNPVGVTRLQHVLEPETEYEESSRAQGGVEDPRVTFVEPLNCWVMAYVGVSWLGPRIALAVSDDLFHWQRLGLLEYDMPWDNHFSQYGNKDGMFFPDVVLDRSGKPALAILHRPTYLVHRTDLTVSLELPPGIHEERESMWIGYISLDKALENRQNLVHVYETEVLATPDAPWEQLKIGGGTPPVRTPNGWLTFYHGVSGTIPRDPSIPKDVCYAAGALLLDLERPTRIIYRSPVPVLQPEKQHEQQGIVPNVVFPTAVDARENGRVDVYYGMADSRIGAACSQITDTSW